MSDIKPDAYYQENGGRVIGLKAYDELQARVKDMELKLANRVKDRTLITAELEKAEAKIKALEANQIELIAQNDNTLGPAFNETMAYEVTSNAELNTAVIDIIQEANSLRNLTTAVEAKDSVENIIAQAGAISDYVDALVQAKKDK